MSREVSETTAFLQQQAERDQKRIKQFQEWLAIEDEQARAKALFDGNIAELEQLNTDALTHCQAQLTSLQTIETDLKELEANGEVHGVGTHLKSIQSSIEEYKKREFELTENKTILSSDANNLEIKTQKVTGSVSKLLANDKTVLATPLFKEEPIKNEKVIRKTRSFAKRAAVFAAATVGCLVCLAAAAACAVLTVKAFAPAMAIGWFSANLGAAIAVAPIAGAVASLTGAAACARIALDQLVSDETIAERQAKAGEDIKNVNTKTAFFKEHAKVGHQPPVAGDAASNVDEAAQSSRPVTPRR